MNRFFLIVMVLVVMANCLCAKAADQPCWRGLNHDGKSAETGLLKQWPEGGPKLLWEVNTIGKGYSTVSVSDGVIYATGDVGDELVVFAFDLSGQLKWKQAIDKAWTRSSPGSRSTPTIDDERLYVLSGNGVLVCMDIKTGKTNWSKNLRDLGGRSGGWGYAESVLILDGLAIAKPGGENCIVAFDKISGEIKWKSAGFKGGPEYSSCVPFTFNGTDLIATGTKSGIVCVSAATGKVLWSNDFCKGNTANCPDPAYGDGYVFWSNGYGKGGICLKLSGSGDDVTAKEVWRTKDFVCHHGGYIIHEGHIYGNHSGGYSCMELATGKVKWHEKAVGKGSLCFADGMLYLFVERGGKAALAAISPDGMEVKGSVTIAGSGPSWAHPVVAGGRVYLRYAENLYCFDIKAK